jgi:hypothetical protein
MQCENHNRYSTGIGRRDAGQVRIDLFTEGRPSTRLEARHYEEGVLSDVAISLNI